MEYDVQYKYFEFVKHKKPALILTVDKVTALLNLTILTNC